MRPPCGWCDRHRPTAYKPTMVQPRKPWARIVSTITEADGRPVVGASITANGFTRTTDTAGRVAFLISALPPGSYVFQIVALDGRAWTYR